MTGKPRGFETVRDMVLSMALVGAVALALYLVVAWQRPEVQGPIRPPVDVSGVLDAVAPTSAFPILRPTGLPSDWTATSAWYQPASENGDLGGALLHVGYETSSGTYAEVKQSDGDADAAIANFADDGEPIGEVNIAGQQWQQLESSDSATNSLLLSDPSKGEPAVVLVTGTADWMELEQLAKSLT